MARGTVAYFTGTVAASGSGVRTAMRDAIVTRLLTYPSGGGYAWSSPGTYPTNPGGAKVVVHSVGDRTLGSAGLIGDTEAWFELSNTSGVGLYTIRDYSTNGPSVSYESTALTVSINDTNAVDYWMVYNEYVCSCVMYQSGTWYALHFGVLERPFEATLSGVARLSSGIPGGLIIGSNALSVDRDLTSSLKVGQPIQLWNYVYPDNSIAAPASPLANNLIVTNVTSGTVTVTSTVTSGAYLAGALLGLDPAAVWSSKDLYTFYGSNARDGTTFSSYGWAMYAPGQTEADVDPDYTGAYTMVPSFLWEGKSGIVAVRGDIGKHVLICALGLQVDKDLMQVNYDASQTYKLFTSVTPGGLSGWGVAIGPGAS
jgi:hypothetical protein